MELQKKQQRDIAIFTSNMRRLDDYWARVQLQTRAAGVVLSIWQLYSVIVLVRGLFGANGSVVSLHWSIYTPWLSNMLVVIYLFFRTGFFGYFYCADTHRGQIQACLNSSLNLRVVRGKLRRSKDSSVNNKAAVLNAAFLHKVAKDTEKT